MSLSSHSVVEDLSAGNEKAGLTALSRHIYAGTSGWAYPKWKPGFYPKEVPARRFLEHYASRLNSVEVNYTFRALPDAEQLAGWLAAVPQEFRFCFKAPETITHRRRLVDCGDAVTEFVSSLKPVAKAGRLGPLLFQLPPNFKADLSKLKTFLKLPSLRRAGRIAFEFRNEGWFTPECLELLRKHNAALCIAESEDLKTPDEQTADFAYYRLRMPGGYDAAAIDAHAKLFGSLMKQGRDVFVYYKHEDEPHGPLAAEAMLAKAAAHGD